MRPGASKIVLYILVLLMSLGVTACQEESQSLNPLWKVTSDNSTVYLLGSVHVLKPSDYPLSNSIDHAFTSSDTVVFELDIAESTSEAATKLIVDYSSYKDDTTLKASLTPETYARLEKALSKRGLNIKNANKLKPWAVGTMLTVEELQRLGFMPAYGVDMQYYTKSLVAGKNIMALEPLEYQLEVFNSMSSVDQDAFVRQSLKEIEGMESEFPDMVKAWKSGNVKGLQKLLEPCEEFKQTCEMIITQRNLNWLPKVENLLKSKGTSLVIVGAAHMVGDDGLVSLLKKKGYKVVQL